MRSHLPAYLRHLASSRAAARTLRSYERVVLAFTAFSKGIEPTTIHVEAFLDRPRLDGHRRAARGRNHELAALRSWFAFLVAKVGWSMDPTAGLDWLYEPPHDPVVLSIGEVRCVFTAAAEKRCPLQRARNLAILAIFSATGLRVHELASISLDQFDAINGTLYAVKGKGGTLHDQVLNDEAVRLVQHWVEVRRGCAATEEAALFVGVRTGRRLSIRAIQHVVHELGQQAGIRRNVSPHTFRHTVATTLLAQETDVVVVASVLRHAKLETTRKYIKLVDTQRRAAVDRLGIVVPRELLEGIAVSAVGNVPPANAGEEELLASTESPVISVSDSSCAQGRLDAASTATVGDESPTSTNRRSVASKRQGSLPEPSSMGRTTGESTQKQTAWPPWIEAFCAITALDNAPVSSSMFDIGQHFVWPGAPEPRTDLRFAREPASPALALVPFAQEIICIPVAPK